MRKSKSILKKLRLVLIIACIYTTSAHAQFFGQQTWLANTQLSSAKVTNIHSPGFLIGTYLTPPAVLQFLVTKTDAFGGFTAGTFSKEYFLQACAGDPIQLYGVSVIETGNASTPATGSNYALATAYEGQPGTGWFLVFATLDLTGAVVNKALYSFPNSATGIGGPTIAESPSSPGTYYITGACGNGNTMYVLCINVSGTILWSKTFQYGTVISPSALMESPYNSNELVVAGATVPPIALNLAIEGFFMKLDAGTGNVNLFNIYGEAMNGGGLCQDFRCMTAAASTNGGSHGYVLGGHCDALPTSPTVGESWLVKLDPNGNVIWSKEIGQAGSTLYEPRFINAVYERLKPGTTTYEYFAGATSQYPTVYRLDASGTLVPSGANRFLYTNATTNGPVLLTALNQGLPNDGIQVYATNNTAGTNNSFIKAYFNGASGCNQTLNTDIQAAGLSQVYNEVVTVGAGLISYSCANFLLTATAISPGIGALCGANSLGGGSNARLSTGIQEYSNNADLLSVQPNPTTGAVLLHLETNTSGHISIDLYNSTGQFIKNIYGADDVSNISAGIDLGTLNLEGGIYFIRSITNAGTSVQKLVYTK